MSVLYGAVVIGMICLGVWLVPSALLTAAGGLGLVIGLLLVFTGPVFFTIVVFGWLRGWKSGASSPGRTPYNDVSGRP